MKHLAAFVAALVLLAFAGVVVWSNRTALTMTHLAFAGACIAVAFGLAIPSDFKSAVETVAPYVPLLKRGPS